MTLAVRKSAFQFARSFGSFRRMASYCALFIGVVSGQTTGTLPVAETLREKGIPVTEPLVIAKCGSCHARDERGNMERISWARATPESWQSALKQMSLLNGVSLTPPEARSMVKYLSMNHGLAPEEAKPVMYDAERRIYEEITIPNDNLRNTCARCHAFARLLSWRRASDDSKRAV